jgi:hypothetical protein
MGYHDAAIDPQERWIGGYRDRGQDIIMASVQHLLDQQVQLLPEQSERLMRQVVDHNKQLVAQAHAMRVMDQDVPAELPSALPSNLSLQAKKQKGNTRKRALTGAEVSERQQKAMTRAQTRAKAIQEARAKRGKERAPKMQTRSQKMAALLQDQQV